MGISGVLIFLFIVGLAGLGGRQVGLAQFRRQDTLARAVEAVTQFELGLQDMRDGNCGLARQRFEYIIQELDPTYPGVGEQLAQALLCTNSTATPTLLPTDALTPTPEGRTPEEIFAETQTLLANQDWDALLDTLDALRNRDRDYRAVLVDGMYYTALRNRGVHRILVEGNLEGGIFDLNRAERFAPLDSQAVSYRQWASWYITGLSFWEIDWAQTVQYLEQVAAAAPNMFDGDFLASDRLATAYVGYAEELIQLGNLYLTERRWCEAQEAFMQASSYAPLSPDVEPTAQWAYLRCSGPAETEIPHLTETPQATETPQE
jgi:tetratricopeptide (TPR) repeat protein